MNKACWLTVLILLVPALSSPASEISRISLSELHEKADLIVMAEVTKVVAEGIRDQVVIKVDKYLKGESPQTVYTFMLVTRGGLKDFDPALKQGDTGVFFLKRGQQEGEVEKAYWGGAAVFPKNHFDLTKEQAGADAAVPLAEWRSYRVKIGQVRNTEDYDRGFLKGFAGPPGLVDGSADYNLGHSDGMRAARDVGRQGQDS